MAIRSDPGRSASSSWAPWRLLRGWRAADALPYGSFEVAPFIGYQLGGNFRDIDTGQHYSLDDHAVFALALDAPADLSSQYELFYSRQPTVLKGYGFAPIDVVVEYLHIGGTIPLDEVLAGASLSRRRPGRDALQPG